MKKKPAPFSGLLLVHKPKGPTSHDLVSKFRWIIGTRAVGHAGTLDPMAEGLMVMLIGEATKVSQWVTSISKTYEGEITLGSETTTDDAEGEVLASFEKVRVQEDEVEEVFQSLLGPQSLSVPSYSAIKQDGQKLYEIARKSRAKSAGSGVGEGVVEDLKTPKREMNFLSSNLKFIEENKIGFKLSCSKGTYVRSWAKEVGRRLDSGAHLSKLLRTECGNFNIESSISIKEAEAVRDLSVEEKTKWFTEHTAFVPLVDSVPESEILRLSPSEEKLFFNGQVPNAARSRLIPLSRKAFREEKACLIRVISSQGELAGLLNLDEKGKVRINRVFNNHTL